MLEGEKKNGILRDIACPGIAWETRLAKFTAAK